MANQLFQGFGGGNVGEVTIFNIATLVNLGKILANGVQFAKIFPLQKFVLYGTC